MIGASKSIWGFDPRSVGGCVVWLDAADRDTLTLSGANITAWRDKSIYGNNINSISTTAPTYNSADSSVNFVASSSTFLRGAISQTNSNASVFLVASIATNPGASLSRLSTLSLSANSNSQLIGQQLMINSNNPQVFTSVPTNTNPTGLGINIQTYISNVTFNTRQLMTNITTYIGTTFTILTLLNGNTQTLSSRTGTFTATTVRVGTYNKYTLGNYPDSSATTDFAYNGKMFEYLVFNNELSVSERQQIEGYLVWKWGINASFATSNAYYYIKPHLTTFRPNDILGCELWFDGADYRTMFQDTAGTTPVTAAGQSVACWKDKIRNISVTDTGISGRASVAPTAVSGGGLLFNNVSASPTSTTQSLGAYLTGATNQTAFLFRMPTKTMTIVTVSLPLSNNGYRRICLLGSDPLSGGPPNFVIGPQMGASEGGSGAADLNSAMSAWGQNFSTSSGYNSNTVLRIDTMIMSNTGLWFTNGTSNTITINPTYTTANSNYPVNFIYFAGYSSTIDGGRSFNGTVYEMLLYSKILTTNERQQVEGYLAHKWGMTASLPATNSYKTIPPAVNTPPIIDPLTNSGGQDSFIMKYDSSGTPLWARRLCGTLLDQAQSVTVDSSGNVIVAGYYQSNPLNIFAANGTTVYFTLTNGGASDAFVVKYNSSGTPLWARRIGGTVSDLANSVSTDSSGNIVVTGYYDSTAVNIFAANGTTVSFTLTNSGNQDSFVVKYDSNGTPLWVRRLGAGSTDIARSITTDSSGNVIVAGYYQSNPFNIFAANGTTVSFTLASPGGNLCFVVKYDSSGTPLWARRLGGTSIENDFANSVSTDSSGNVIVGGQYTGAINIFAANGSTISFTLTNSGSNDAFIVKYDSSGTPLWARRLAGTDFDALMTVSTDSSGNIIVVGYYSLQLNIFAANGTTVSFTLTNSGGQDCFVVKYDSNGTPLWARRLGAGSNDVARSITTDSSGNVIVVGSYFTNSLNIFAANGTTVSFTLTNSGGQDSFIVKYDSSGTPLWARRLGGAGTDIANSVSTDSSGNVIVGGQYTSNPLSFYPLQ